MLTRTVVAAVGLTLVLTGAAAADENGLVVKQSAHGVIETVDRLEQILGDKGITVMARIDHAENAAKVDEELPPTELLVFGNPALGTPLMQSGRTIGIDLPMKALVWEDADGKVWLAYNDPSWLVARHGIEDESEIAGKMTGALEQITDGATGE
jgi:uncharacterized protein (DUF302 family)